MRKRVSGGQICFEDRRKIICRYSAGNTCVSRCPTCVGDDLVYCEKLRIGIRRRAQLPEDDEHKLIGPVVQDVSQKEDARVFNGLRLEEVVPWMPTYRQVRNQLSYLLAMKMTRDRHDSLTLE